MNEIVERHEDRCGQKVARVSTRHCRIRKLGDDRQKKNTKRKANASNRKIK
jgi:hypothetical protein